MTATMRLEGERELAAKLTKEAIAGGPARRLLDRSRIVVQGNARGFAKVDRGRWRNSIQSETDTATFPEWAVVGSNLDYAPYADLGRKPGRMPPHDVIAAWVARQGMPPSAVFPIRRAIGRRGVKGDHALERGLDASKPAILGFVGLAAREIESEAGR